VTDTGPVDVAIVDLDFGELPPVMNAKVLITLSVKESNRQKFPERARFCLKPVDVDVLMDWVLDELKRLQ